MSLKKILASVAASAIAVSAIATSASAAEVTVEKEFYSAGGSMGTAKMKAEFSLGNYSFASSSSTAVINIPGSFDIDWEASVYQGRDFHIQADSLKINGHKVYANDGDNVLIKNDVAVTATILGLGSAGSTTYGSSTSTGAVNLAAGSMSKVTVEATLIPALLPAEDAGTKAIMEHISEAKIKGDVTGDFSGVKTLLADGTAQAQFAGTSAQTFDLSNVSAEPGDAEVTDTNYKVAKFTVAEKAAIQADGATIKVVAELSKPAKVGSELTYLTLTVKDVVKNTDGAKKVAVLADGETSISWDLAKSDLYNAEYDEYNTEFRVVYPAQLASNGYIKSAKLVIAYDDGTVEEIDTDDVADAGEEEAPALDEDEDLATDEGDDVVAEEDGSSDEDDATASEDDANVNTGVAFAIVPAAIAAAGVVIARKRK